MALLRVCTSASFPSRMATAVMACVSRRIAIGLAVLAALAAGSPAQAGPIDLRLDLSNLVGTTGGNWNNIANLNAVTAGLIDFSTGAPTTVSIAGASWTNFFGDDGGTFPNADWVVQPATRDGAGIGTNSNASFVLSGLTAASYTIEIVSARTTFNYLNTFLVGGALADRTFLGTPVQTPWNSTTDGLAAGNWLIWDNVVPVGGSILITNSTTTTLGILNALRVSEAATVPEPSALLLLGGGLAAAALRRRRTTR